MVEFYAEGMIISFKSKDAELIWLGQGSRKLPQQIQNVTRRKLRMLNNAYTLDDLKIPPANRLEALKGDRSGQYSIRINNQYRICFVWQDGRVMDVDIVDYH